MDSINIKISDYRAIKRADIIIGGITLMAGQNGCGKSTVSQVLNALVNGINNFHEDLLNDVYNYFRMRVSRMRRGFVTPEINRVFASIIESKPDYGDLLGQMKSAIDLIYKVLIDYINKTDKSEELERRIFSIIGEPDDKAENIEDRLTHYCETLSGRLESSYNNALEQLESRDISTLLNSIQSKYYIFDSTPSVLELSENGHSILDNGRFKELLSFRRSIYIDTTATISQAGYSMNYESLKKLVMSDLQESENATSRLILKELSLIIGGKIYRDEEYGGNLKYKDGNGVNIYLEDSASGIQSMSVLYRLLYAGLLDNETILILDEPESHLHPQWLVALARILIRINKLLGTKILIASHSPDMVSAIFHLGRKNEVEDMRFYQTYKESDSTQFVFKDCGSEISGIFESFNLALDRIGDYGAMVQE